MSQSFNQTVIERLKAQFPQSIEATTEFRGDITVQIKKSDIVRVCQFLKSDAELAFDMVIDLCGVDMYRPENRFEVIYNLYSLSNKEYLRLKVLVDEKDCVVDSMAGVWSGANWHERETYDMFGISFAGHPDLRRMYMPEEFEYFPLRKDFPLMGIPDSIPLPRKK
jgi:NADH-quinone oxidoreductase subunit C